MRLAVVLMLLLGGAACDDRLKCSGDSDQTTCPQGETCVWLGLDGKQGYFCAQICSADEPCDHGETCKENRASSCQVCDDVLNVCD